MSLTPEQYLALTQIAYTDFADWPAAKNMTINQLLASYDVSGEGTQTVAALSNMGGYKLINYQANTTSGFAGAAFQAPPGPNGEPGEIVFALRGTEPDFNKDFMGALRDFEADLEIATDVNLSGPSQFDDAFDFWTSALQSVGSGNYGDYSFTGHSLGGGLAQYMTYMTNEVGHSVTFNAVGIGQVLDGVNPSDYYDSITDYVNQNDVIGQYGVQLGQTIYKTDTGNYQFNSSVDNGQLALQLAIMQAMQQGNMTQAAGMAALNAIAEAGQGTLNAGSDVFFGAHGLDTLITTNGDMSQTVSDPNEAIEMLTRVVNGFFTVTGWVVDGINYFAVEIIPATGEATVKVTLAIAEGAIQVVTTVGEAVYNWVNFMGETTADIIYNTALAVGNATNTVAEVAASLYQYLFGDFVTINGTGGADSLSPYTLNPVPAMSTVINGYSGDDSITGSSFNDSLDGGSGNDTVMGIDGNDYIYGRDGDDKLVGGWGADVLIGGAGNDSLYGDQDESTGAIYYAVPKEDVLDGGTGNDYLAGGGGNDKYIFRVGDGQDIIDDKSRSYNYDSFGSGGDADTLAFQAGINPSNVVVTRGQYDLYLNIAGTTDSITIQNYFVNTSGTIEQITFADGTIWSEAAIREKARYIEGTSSDNVLQGFYDQSDIIHGYAGNDNINASSGDDFVFGGDGDDIIIGEQGTDTLSGGAGNDTIYGGSQTSQDSFFGPVYYNDLLDGGSGDDQLEGGSGDDTYVFGKGYGNDTIHDFAYDVVSSNNAGFDTIRFLSSVDPENIDVYRSGSYDLTFKIIDTNETIKVKDFFTNNGFSRVEQATFTDGTVWDINTILEKARTINGTSAGETIDVTSYYDQNNIVNAGAGDDMVTASNGNDILNGEAGNDTLVGGYGDDVLDGGAGNDTLNGGVGNDTYKFGAGYGQDVIYDDAANGNSGTDTIQLIGGLTPDDVNVFRIGSDLEIRIKNTSDTLRIQNHFGSYVNTVENIAFANGTTWDTSTISQKAVVLGTSGDDSLTGDGQNNTLVGLAGNDTLYGGSGDDTYLFALGDGQDTIYEENGVDKIQLGAGIDPDDVTVKRVQRYNGGNNTYYDLELSIAGTSDKITIQQYFGYNGYNGMNNTPNQMIEQVAFVDGTIWTQSMIYDKVHNIVGTTGDDSLASFDNDAVNYQGLAGNDNLTGAGGNDTLDGGTGNDTLSGGSGNDLLTGGKDNDTLYGGSGDDNYVFALGDGQDSIYEESGTDTIQFASGISPEDVTVKRVERYGGNVTYYDLQISIAGSSDVITVQQYFGYSGWNGMNNTPNQMIEQIAFANGTTWTQSTIYDKVHNLTGTAVGDSLSAYDGGDVVFHGLAGNDSLVGGTGNDTLDGGANDDSISGGGGNDTVIGGTGSDTLYGGSGDDTYVFALGDGQDTIYEEYGTDTVQFAADITPQDVVAKRVERYGGNVTYYDLELSIAGTDDKITVQQYFGYSGWNGFSNTPNQMIEQVVFADSTVWTQSTIYDMLHNLSGTAGSDNMSAYDSGDVTYHGLAGSDTLYGNIGNDTLDGGANNDTLSGSGGNDTLIGGENDDTLYGGSGDDTYIFALGNGQDTIYEESGTDAIQFASGVDPSDVIAKRVERNSGSITYFDLELSIAGTNDKITVQQYFGYSSWSGMNSTPNQMIDQITFADSTVWTQSTIYDKVHNLVGTTGNDNFVAYDNGNVNYQGLAGNDSLVGNVGNDTIDGGDGADYLSGAGGDDVLLGGAGNDSMDGGSGNDIHNGGAGDDTSYDTSGGDDTYVFAAGDGQDTIYDYTGADTIQFSTGIDPDDIIAKRVIRAVGWYAHYDLELSIAGTNDKLTIQDYFGYDAYNGLQSGTNYMIEQFTFADSTVWTPSTIDEKMHNMSGTSGNDVMAVYDNLPAVFYGLAGNDSLTGGGGNDTLDGGDGDDSISGAAGADILVGGAGIDSLDGGDGEDILTGGTGNDALYGGYSNDTYIFNPGDGQDFVYDYNGTDTAELNRNLMNVMFERVGNDLKVTMNGSTDAITVGYWYSNDTYKVETFKASDGSTISSTQIEQLIQAMASFSNDNGMSWSQALDNQSATAQSVISQYWTAPTV